MLFMEAMGSYRRGKSTCGDVDILLTRPTHDGKTHKGEPNPFDLDVSLLNRTQAF